MYSRDAIFRIGTAIRRRAIVALGIGLLLGAASVAAAEFSGERAMHWLVQQCEIGPRTPGSSGIQALRDSISTLAGENGLGYAELCFTRPDPYEDADLRLCNLVVSAGPGDSRHLWIGAHYDSRPFCDLETDPEKAALPLVGANDGASGTAILMHLIEILGETPPPRGVDLIFFDGEDYGRSGDLDGFCLGSRELAANWDRFGSPLARGLPDGLIVLDMVGETGLRVPIEGYSQRYAEKWTRSIFDRARDIGLTVLDPTPGVAVFDDHIPFLQAGIPAVDLIDFDYPQWHTNDDVPAHCSAVSLAEIGRLMVDIIYNPLP